MVKRASMQRPALEGQLLNVAATLTVSLLSLIGRPLIGTVIVIDTISSSRSQALVDSCSDSLCLSRSLLRRVLISIGTRGSQGSYLVDPASSHMLVSKIKPCMSKYKLLIL